MIFLRNEVENKQNQHREVLSLMVLPAKKRSIEFVPGTKITEMIEGWIDCMLELGRGT